MLSQPQQPVLSPLLSGAAVQAWDTRRGCLHVGQGRGWRVYMLYLATCLSSPPLILAGEAGLPEKGGGFAHLDPRPMGGRVETKRAQIW